MNDWNYDAHHRLPSLPVSEVQKFNRLIFVVRSVPLFQGQSTMIMEAAYSFRNTGTHLSD